jgi:hypothetical protein
VFRENFMRFGRRTDNLFESAPRRRCRRSVAYARSSPVECFAIERIVVSPTLDALARPNSTVASPLTSFSLSNASVTNLVFSWTDVHLVDESPAP